jgi:hypothetical protein
MGTGLKDGVMAGHINNRGMTRSLSMFYPRIIGL